MIAFEIEIDGARWVCAGMEDWSILAFHLNASRHEPGSAGRDDYVETRVGGLTLPNGEGVQHHFRWPAVPLEIGSRVTIQVVETTQVDPPKKRYRSDAIVQEDPFTEEESREMRYRDYLELKAEFEGEAKTDS